MDKRPARACQLRLPAHPILVAGDIMCDHYVWGDVERISPEAPVPVMRWEREADRPGGAANAAVNLAALGCRVYLAGLVGNDEPGRWLLQTLRASGVDTRGVIRSSRRATTLKTRVIARGQHLLRIDRETGAAVDSRDEQRLVSVIQRLTGRLSGVVCSDYNKGVLSTRVLRALLGGKGKPFALVDPKGRDYARYKGADLLTPNERELAEAVPDDDPAVSGTDIIERRARSLMSRLLLKALLVTRGANGMDLFEAGGRTVRRTHIAAAQRHEVFDVTGAGDTVAAVLAMGAAAGWPLADAARLANAAAGMVVGVVGTSVAEAEALATIFYGEASLARSKVLSLPALAARVADARAHGRAVVFTSGRFDVLDVDDLRTLQRARAQGDLLVVGVEDESKGGPQRAELVGALRVVDYVTLFPSERRAQLVRTLQPDVII